MSSDNHYRQTQISLKYVFMFLTLKNLYVSKYNCNTSILSDFGLSREQLKIYVSY